MSTTFSIVIPVFNSAKRLDLCLKALEKLEYPKELIEVIVVDNRSEDESTTIARRYPFVKLQLETTHQQSPYSARNRGIEVARNDVVVFLDATCCPLPWWLSSADSCFSQHETSLVTGPIEFEIVQGATIGEIYDSLFNVNPKAAAQKGWAPGGNVFIRRSLLERHGMFAEGARSGEDYRLTKDLTTYGYKLIYCEKAKVTYPPRPLSQVLIKQKRVARGQVNIWIRTQRVPCYLIKSLFRGLLPPNPFSITLAIRKRGKKWMKKKFIALYIIRYYINFIMFFENVRELINKLKR